MNLDRELPDACHFATAEAAARELGIEPQVLRRASLVTAALLFYSRDWIRRRVESVALLDERMARRTVEVDFETPVVANLTHAFSDYDKQLPFVPLTLMQKRKIRVFNLIDEAGRTVPSVTGSVRTRVAVMGLVGVAEGVNDGPLDEDTENDLIKVAAGPPQVAVTALEKLHKTCLMEDDQLAELAAALTWGHVMLVPMFDGPRRHILRFSYDERAVRESVEDYRIHEPQASQRMRRERGASARKRQRELRRNRLLGTEPRRLWFPATAIGQTASYHFEFSCPLGLQVIESELRLTSAPSPNADPYRVSEERVQEASRTLDFEEGSLQVTHLYARDAPQTGWGLVSIDLLPRRTTTFHAALMVSVLVLVTLLAAWPFIDSIEARTAATLFLLGPSVLATYVVSHDEHSMVSRLLFGIRAFAVASGAASFLGAGLLVIVGKGAPSIIWLLPLAIAVAACWLLFRAWSFARFRPYRGPDRPQAQDRG